jgi:hypothetical protein
MFGDDTFASLTFADFFITSGVVQYEFRFGRTTVIANVPGNGTILSDLEATQGRSKVEAVIPDDGKVVNSTSQVKIRTKVEAVKIINIATNK